MNAAVTSSSLVDIASLQNDLRLAVEYASRAGLISDKKVFDTVRAAEEAVRSERPMDFHTVSAALSEVARVIAPITIADLNSGRDPFLPQNQRKARVSQFWLSVASLIVLLLVGFFMHALRVEQDAIAAVDRVQELHPELQLTALRNMAQHDQPLLKRSALYDEFYQKVSDLRRINSQLASTYTELLNASEIPLLPLGQFFQNPLPTVQVFATAEAAPPPQGDAPPAQDQAASDPSPQQPMLCKEDANGNGISLPEEASAYPSWIRSVLADTLSDFCFQLNVLSPDGSGTPLNQTLGHLALVAPIKRKVSLRVSWFLPFLYGLLGSTIYMMRSMASVRTPATNWIQIAMRLSLGGVAGIVIGWFASTSSIETTAALSVPFALAFLTGYGIDALFTLLDRLSRAMGDAPKSVGG